MASRGGDPVPIAGVARGTLGTHLESQPSLGMALQQASECSGPGFTSRPHQVALDKPWASLSLCLPLENRGRGYAHTCQDGPEAG